MKKAFLCLLLLLSLPCGAFGAQSVEFSTAGGQYAYTMPKGYVGEENTMASFMKQFMVELLGDYMDIWAVLFESKSLDNMLINPEGVNYLMIASDPSQTSFTQEEFELSKSAFSMALSGQDTMDLVADYASSMVAEMLGTELGFDLANATLVQDKPQLLSMYTIVSVPDAGLENPKYCLFSLQLAGGGIFFVYQYFDYGPDADPDALTALGLNILAQLDLRQISLPAATPGDTPAVSTGRPTKSTRNAWR